MTILCASTYLHVWRRVISRVIEYSCNANRTPLSLAPYAYTRARGSVRAGRTFYLIRTSICTCTLHTGRVYTLYCTCTDQCKSKTKLEFAGRQEARVIPYGRHCARNVSRLVDFYSVFALWISEEPMPAINVRIL